MLAASQEQLPADATVLSFTQFAGPSGTNGTTHMSLEQFGAAGVTADASTNSVEPSDAVTGMSCCTVSQLYRFWLL